MGCEEHEFAVLEVGGVYFGGKFWREEFSTKRGKRPNFERFGYNRLQIVVGR